MSKPPKYIHDKMGGKLSTEQIAPYVILPGSPNRIKKIVSYWDSHELLAEHYEFHIHSGNLNGQKITTCSTGIVNQ